MISRREMMQTTVAAGLTPTVVAAERALLIDGPRGDPARDGLHAGMNGNETIAMVVYPEFTALDLFGPYHMFASLMGAKVLLAAETLDPVASDTGVRVLPTTTFADCPEELTVVFVPGGTRGTLRAAESPAVRRFLKSRGERAGWIASVCTGSLILGAAGLLEGYRATSHWAARSQLALFGARPVDERVVVDRNRITGAGVTSGLDFGLSLVQKLRGTSYAQSVQLISEYDPRPPLDSGSEKKAPPEVLKAMRAMFVGFNADVDQLARRIAAERKAAK